MTDDMIWRGDALEAYDQIHNYDDPALRAAIAALPCGTVGVRPDAAVHRAVMDWIRDDAGAAVKMSMTPVLANALTARILAALTAQPATDALDELARLGQEWDADDVEPCGKCMGSGYGGHPDSGALCTDCHGKGGIIRRPAPDAQAIREAALREAADVAGGVDVSGTLAPKAKIVAAILAPLPKGGA